MRILYRIETRRLVLRPFALGEEAALLEAIGSCLDYLRQWLPWAVHEPESLASKRARIARTRRDMAAGERMAFGIFEDARIVGGMGMTPLVPSQAWEVGYWVRQDAAGRGVCGEATQGLVSAAMRYGGCPVAQIDCDPRNLASARIPERLGFSLLETRRADKRDPQGAPRDTQVWVLDREAYLRSPCASAAVLAFDANGHRLA